MKKILLVCSIFSIIIDLSYGQAPQVEWAKVIGGTGKDYTTCVEADPLGNIILVGAYLSPSIKLGTITLTKNITTAQDESDIYIIKLDPKGNALWAISAGGKDNDEAKTCKTDKQGNIYVQGWFKSQSIKFGTITLTNINYSKGSRDMFIAKFSAKGDCLWAKSVSGAGGNEEYSSIVLDPQNNLIISAAISDKIMDFGKGNKISFEKKMGFFIAKYTNNTGELIWVKGGINASVQSIDIDAAGNVFATAESNGDKIIVEENLIQAQGTAPICFIIKYTPLGKVSWTKSFGLNTAQSALCKTDAQGNVYVGGKFYDRTLAIGNTTLNNNGFSENVYIAKYDNNGNFLWAKATGGMNGESVATSCSEFYVDAKGNVYMTGLTMCEFSFAGKIIPVADNSVNVFLIKYDSNGKEIWGLSHGGTAFGFVSGENIKANAQGNILLSGYFDIKSLKIGNTNLSNTGQSDIFIVKYSNH